MARRLDEGPSADSRRSDHASSAAMNAAGGTAAPRSVLSSVWAKVALMRRPRTPAIMSFEKDGEHQLASVDSKVAGLREIAQAAG